MREQPEQQAPPVQRLRIQYAKRGRLRFTSHRDFSRAFERAVFRARVPMAYSSGFNPHPRISYAGAAPTGSASEAEYLELALAQVVDPADVHAALDEAMPDGLDIVETVVSPGGALADQLQASHWWVDLVVDPEQARAAVAAFLAADSVPVSRMTKKGLREFDCRASVLALVVTDPDPEAAPQAAVRLDLRLRHAVPAVRPDDVLTGLASVAELSIEGSPLLTRLAQGPLDPETGEIGDPLRPSA
ncbi:TIGR03936 family radical SAM-associated protein [Nocardioides sp.]|uniref:TIGR03936 family radical SAM-associated protein n=1 Tax=Nocardioides sp. TaxID=35761 RepID=UPI0035637C02